MPANVVFTEFTDAVVFLENKEAANTFFGTIEVPNATLESYGVVKKAASVAGSGDLTSPFSLTLLTVRMLKEDGTYETVEVCDKTEVQTALNTLRTKVNALIAALQASGGIA